MKTKKQMKRWFRENLALSLDELSQMDADMLHEFAEEKPYTFYHLVTQALLERRAKTGEPMPVSLDEINAFRIEFRTKVLLVHFRFGKVPAAPLFDITGMPLLTCQAFSNLRMHNAFNRAETGGMA